MFGTAGHPVDLDHLRSEGEQRARQLFKDATASMHATSSKDPYYRTVHRAHQAADVLVALYDADDDKKLLDSLKLVHRYLKGSRHGIAKRLLIMDIGYIGMVHRHFRQKPSTSRSTVEVKLIEQCVNLVDARCPP